MLWNWNATIRHDQITDLLRYIADGQTTSRYLLLRIDKSLSSKKKKKTRAEAIKRHSCWSRRTTSALGMADDDVTAAGDVDRRNNAEMLGRWTTKTADNGFLEYSQEALRTLPFDR